MSNYAKMMAQYEALKPKQNKPRISEADRMKRYFSAWIPETEKSADKVIRILPDPNGGSPFVNIKVHSIQVDGRWEKFICPEFSEGKPCPFCEARRELLNTGNEDDKKLAKTYNERDMFVLRIIERGKEADGVKFWRFNRDFTNNGVFDKIMTVVKLLGEDEDITSPTEGFDLVISINKDQNNRPSVVGIQAKRKPTPLTDDAELTESLLSNTDTWEDVYSKKSYEFLSLIVQGKTPVWSSEAKGYVSKEELDQSTAKNNSVASQGVKDLIERGHNKTETTTFTGGDELEDDDLPF